MRHVIEIFGKDRQGEGQEAYWQTHASASNPEDKNSWRRSSWVYINRFLVLDRNFSGWNLSVKRTIWKLQVNLLMKMGRFDKRLVPGPCSIRRICVRERSEYAYCLHWTDDVPISCLVRIASDVRRPNFQIWALTYHKDVWLLQFKANSHSWITYTLKEFHNILRVVVELKKEVVIGGRSKEQKVKSLEVFLW